MTRISAMAAALLALAGFVLAQSNSRPMSPDGTAQAQVLGKWTKGDRPAFTLGRENYVGG